MARTDARALHRDAIVIDLVCPLANQERHLDEWMRGGVTALGPTVAADDGLESAMTKLATWLERLGRRRDLAHVTHVDDFARAKKDGRLGIVFHFQNTQPFERNAELVEVYYRLGVRVTQLTYNVRNWVGDGCAEPADSGLSDFGRRIVREMNRVGMVVDLSHTGYRTTMEAMEVSTAPCIVSHANARAVHDSARNLRDDQIDAVAAQGGVIGLNGFPAFVSKRRWPTLDDLLRHADYIAGRVGTDHLSVGIDYYQGQWPFADAAAAKALYAASVRSGRWSPVTYPAPPYKYPRGIEVPSKLGALTRALLARGYAGDDVRKILGGNLLRVFGKVWR
ncbi:MAG: membrane dipeptidase [Candidatus Rokubacteria bacterium]|nr:membrane dipeptidase [Candidatus Rokubacteria bacterium]